MATPSFLTNAVAAAIKLKNKIQLAGLLIAIVGYVATKIVSPEEVLSQISGGSIGILILIFGTALQILQTLPQKSRANFFLVLFSMTIILITILLWFTLEMLKDGNKVQVDLNHQNHLAQMYADSIAKADSIYTVNKPFIDWFMNGTDAMGTPLSPPFATFSDTAIMNQIDQRLDFYLLMAAGTRRYEMVRLLAKRGGDVNREAKEYNTPIILASRKHDPEMVRVLIELGADPNLSSTSGTLPIDFAKIDQDSKPRLFDDNLIRVLVKGGADVDQIDKFGTTLLTKAVWQFCDQKENAYVVRFLIDLGANPAKKDGSGKTALDYANRCRDKNKKAEMLSILSPKRG